jgi:hypothetical protein
MTQKPIIDESQIWTHSPTDPANDVQMPNAGRFATGWQLAEKPPYNEFNWFWQYMTQWTVSVNQTGSPAWDDQTEYRKGALVWHNETVYQATSSNQNSEPGTGTEWRTMNITSYLPLIGGKLTGELEIEVSGHTDPALTINEGVVDLQGTNTKIEYVGSNIEFGLDVQINNDLSVGGTTTLHSGKMVTGYTPSNDQDISTKKYVADEIATLDGTVLKKDGSVELVTGYTPSNDQDISTKKYVDDNVTNVSGQFLKKDGSVQLDIFYTPTNDRDIATKEYVDDEITTLDGVVLKKDGSVPLDTGYTPSNDRDIATKEYVDDEITTLDGVVLKKDGSVPLDNTYTPANDQDIATKDYVDTAIRVGNSGDTASRPTTPVVGEQYYDTDLELPIWYNGSDWKDAAGNIV